MRIFIVNEETNCMNLKFDFFYYAMRPQSTNPKPRISLNSFTGQKTQETFEHLQTNLLILTKMKFYFTQPNQSNI